MAGVCFLKILLAIELEFLFVDLLITKSSLSRANVIDWFLLELLIDLFGRFIAYKNERARNSPNFSSLCNLINLSLVSGAVSVSLFNKEMSLW